MDVPYPLCIEFKHRKHGIPLYLRDALAQAKADAKEDEFPIVIQHEPSTRHDVDVVSLELQDFERLIQIAWPEIQ